MRVAYFSFNPSPAFLETTATVPSSKLQDEAASAIPAAKSKPAERSDLEKCMVAVGVAVV